MSSWRVNRANDLRLILTSPDNHRLFSGIGLFRRDCLACAGYLGRICGGVVPGGVSGPTNPASPLEMLLRESP
jgi:hypothetical protein